MRLRNLFALAVLSLAAMAGAGCGGAEDSTSGEAAASGGDGATLSLVAYSTPEVVYDEIIPAFQKTEAGSGVQFKTSFGASGEQSRAVEGGQAADVVTFSLEPDVTRLVKAGLVNEDWSSQPHDGLVTTSLVSFIVRKGNPKGIETWEDLLKPGVEVVTPNPFTSGAAKWNLLAAYGAAGDGGKDDKAGLDYVRELVTEHIEVQPKSGREALQAFIGGQGDVLLSYEYEATTAQKKGEELDFVVPDDTIRIENPIAVTSEAPEQAQAFVDYVLSKPGQERFAEWGYRPVNEEVLEANSERFPEPSGLFTIRDLGGWPTVDAKLFDPENGDIAKIEEEAGISTAK
jgi:sulfate transport system substrate-binding protein